MSTPQDMLQQKVHVLQTALEQQDPEIKGHLREIHKLLIQHEELVHLLSDDEISKIMKGQQIVTNTALAAEVTGAKAKKTASKKAATFSAADL